MSAEDESPDDLRGFEYECPKCGKVLSEYAERCPYCGQNLFEVFSGTFRPRRRLGAKLLILLVLAVFILAILGVFIGSLHGLIRAS